MEPISHLRRGSLYVFLLALVGGLISVNLPFGYYALEGLISWSILSIGFAAGASAVSTSRKAAWVAWILASTAILLRGLAQELDSPMTDLAGTLLTIVLFVFIGYRITCRVFDRTKITHEKIAGAVTIFLLIGIVWGNLYTSISLVSPEAFNFSTRPAHLNRLHEDLMYFSFITLTTVGYGDITAVSSFVRSLTALEACIGVLFPNILIARLVSLEIMHSQEDMSSP